MLRLLVALSTSLACGVAAGARAGQGTGDPLRAPECQEAIAALQEQEAAAASAPAAGARAERRSARRVDPKLAAARKHAASRCLASRADPPAPGRLAQPPLPVPPVTSARPALPPTSIPQNANAPRPPGPPPLTSITSCDAAGCWTSDGSRLNRVGPTLWGSRGACTVQGTVVLCP